MCQQNNKLMILQVEGIDLNRAWDVNPNDGSAYGALVMLLIFAIIGLVFLLKQERNRNNELNDKLHDAFDTVTDKLSEVKTGHFEVKGNQEKILYILEDLKNKLK